MVNKDVLLHYVQIMDEICMHHVEGSSVDTTLMQCQLRELEESFMGRISCMPSPSILPPLIASQPTSAVPNNQNKPFISKETMSQSKRQL